MAAKKSKPKQPEKKVFTDSNFPVKRIYQIRLEAIDN